MPNFPNPIGLFGRSFERRMIPRVASLLNRDDEAAKEILMANPGIRGHVLNRINGLHPGGSGPGANTIKVMTDFGSPLDLAKAVFRAAKTFSKAEQNQVFIMPEKVMSSEEREIVNRTAVRRMIHNDEFPKAAKHYSGVESDVTGYQMPGFMKQRIKDRMLQRPTVGLVTNVLGDPRFNQGHKAFSGKSYS